MCMYIYIFVRKNSTLVSLAIASFIWCLYSCFSKVTAREREGERQSSQRERERGGIDLVCRAVGHVRPAVPSCTRPEQCSGRARKNIWGSFGPWIARKGHLMFLPNFLPSKSAWWPAYLEQSWLKAGLLPSLSSAPRTRTHAPYISQLHWLRMHACPQCVHIALAHATLQYCTLVFFFNLNRPSSIGHLMIKVSLTTCFVQRQKVHFVFSGPLISFLVPPQKNMFSSE